MTDSEFFQFVAETIAYMSTNHYDYNNLAARVYMVHLHEQTSSSFANTINRLHEAGLISDDVNTIVAENAETLDATVLYERDFSYNFFGLMTLVRSYLLCIEKKVVERPQHMIMRVAIGIHKNDIEAAIQTYDLMSRKFFIHATPTLFNAGTCKPQLASCFLATVKDDSIEGIYDTLRQCAVISKHAGGIGLNISNIRAAGSSIKGTMNFSKGIVPIMRVFNESSCYVGQGGGKRPGSIAMYLEPWHADIFDFLRLKDNTGDENRRARDLFFALWIPDLFMKRVENNANWSLFCPNEAPGLNDLYGKEFEKQYEDYENRKLARDTIEARKLWYEIYRAQSENGMPFILYKDACNIKSNQNNLGTIKCSNLCTEIVEYTSHDEIAVCNLASIALPNFIINHKDFDYEKLHEVCRIKNYT